MRKVVVLALTTSTFSRPGTFEYTCLIHEIFGMKATIVVK